MFTHLRDQQKFPESRAKFYCMNLALGIGYLHSIKCIYRDLKPENILFEEDGYLTITDFGLVKRLEEGQQTATFCGTPEYMAPEIIKY